MLGSFIDVVCREHNPVINPAKKANKENALTQTSARDIQNISHRSDLINR
jgi:hypothetical protein